MIYLNFLTWAIAVSAFTYSNILTEPGMILFEVDSWLDDQLTGRWHWVFKILIHCQYCVAGQWALWYYPLYILSIHHSFGGGVYLWFILQTIFITKVITWLYYTVFKF